MTRKHRKVCTTLTYIEHLYYISVSASTSLLGICKGIINSAIGLNVCSIWPELKSKIEQLRKRKRSINK